MSESERDILEVVLDGFTDCGHTNITKFIICPLLTVVSSMKKHLAALQIVLSSSCFNRNNYVVIV